jgi:hypothetical protein
MAGDGDGVSIWDALPMRSASAALTLLILAGLAGGCGSSTNSASTPTSLAATTSHPKTQPITPSEYAVRVNALCVYAKSHRIRVAGGTPSSFALEVQGELPHLSKFYRQVQAIPVPPSERRS